MQSKSRNARKKSLVTAFVWFGVAFAFGFLPVLTNALIDPYQVVSKRDRPTAINDLAEKAHYPLWKLAKYNRGTHDTIILGDSRARALRDKYWHEAGTPKALNLAYGGGTIPEIYSTFKQMENDRAIKRLVIGIQLRSFDENHKGGMDRVPEAVKLLANHFNYLKNWHVAKTSARMFQVENAEALERVKLVAKQFSLDANASELGKTGETPLKKLLEPKVCFGCDLPRGLRSVPYVKTGASQGHGRRHDYLQHFMDNSELRDINVPAFYQTDHAAFTGITDQGLPKKFARQVKRNGSADWRGFSESERYWHYLEKIASWAEARKVELVFVIPPTIVAMQHTISKNGLSKHNHEMRLRLTKLGKVIDLDFPNSLTLELTNFTDAYHFNSKVARSIVHEIILTFKNARKIKKRKTTFDLKCKPVTLAKNQVKITDDTYLAEGMNCRTWERKS